MAGPEDTGAVAGIASGDGAPPSGPRPPERAVLESGAVLRRARPDDAEAFALAVHRSLDHLRPWMPWASPDNATADHQRTRLATADGTWDDGTDMEFGVWAGDESEVIGGCGLMRRVGPGAIEIGYWIHVDHVGNGHATAAARALTDAAWDLDDIERVEIHCDVANVASAAVPAHLGYRHDRTVDRPVATPGETGRLMIWIADRPAPG
jgi:RimJ/RimL family protein N-acetyltransferase